VENLKLKLSETDAFAASFFCACLRFPCGWIGCCFLFPKAWNKGSFANQRINIQSTFACKYHVFDVAQMIFTRL